MTRTGFPPLFPAKRRTLCGLEFHLATTSICLGLFLARYNVLEPVPTQEGLVYVRTGATLRVPHDLQSLSSLPRKNLVGSQEQVRFIKTSPARL